MKIGYIDKLYNRFKFNNEKTMEQYSHIYKLSKKEVKEMLENKPLAKII